MRVLCLFLLLLGVAFGLHAETGVSERRIVLASHLPLSGPAASFSETAKGAQAFLEYVNDQGGVHGRRIDLQVQDDRFLPEGALESVDRMMAQDPPLLVFLPSGDQTHEAVRPLLKQWKRPSFLIQSHARKWTEPIQPEVFALLPTPQAEARALSRFLRQKPRMSITVWYQDTPDYREAAGWIRAFLEDSMSLRFIVTSGRHAALADEVEALRNQRAQAVILVAEYGLSRAFLEVAEQTDLDGDFYVGSALAEIRTPKTLPEPFLRRLFVLSQLPLPLEQEHLGIQLHQKLLEIYQPGQQMTRWTIQGQAAAELLVRLLEDNGRDLTVPVLLETAERFSQPAQSLLPAVSFSPSQHRALMSFRISRLFPDRVEHLSSWIDGR